MVEKCANSWAISSVVLQERKLVASHKQSDANVSKQKRLFPSMPLQSTDQSCTIRNPFANIVFLFKLQCPVWRNWRLIFLKNRMMCSVLSGRMIKLDICNHNLHFVLFYQRIIAYKRPLYYILGYKMTKTLCLHESLLGVSENMRFEKAASFGIKIITPPLYTW